MFQRMKWLAALVAIMTAVTGCTGSSRQAEATPTPIPTPIVPTKPTYVVQRGEVTKILEFNGRVAPVTEEELFFRAGGYVSVVYVTRNQEVKTGDILAELEVTDLQNQLAQAQADLEAIQLASERQMVEAQASLNTAEWRLAQARAQSSDLQVIIAEVDLERAQTALADAQEEYEKDIHRDWETQEEHEAFARRLREAELNLRIAEASYQAALQARRAHSYDIQILQQEVDLARLRLEEIEAGLDIERAELAIQRLEGLIADARIVAPFDGIVLSLNVAEGRLVDAYRTVMSVADTRELEISANLDQQQMQDLAEGMPVAAELTSRPGEVIPGTIRQLPYPYGSGGRTTTGQTGEQVGGVDTSTRITLNPRPGIEYELGDLFRVTVVLESKEDVLWLPPQAIRTFEGRRFVVVQDGSAQRRVDVTIGIEGEDRIEIEEGLTEGQVVVSP